ncbi:MAG TPA: glycosyltransferase family 2 protein [Thermoanaerobaculia bacterium]|nr:glycosyltransferase family 2 protein [Thermoanaerobaculia bacterium]
MIAEPPAPPLWRPSEVWIVVPCHDEGPVVGGVVRELLRVFPRVVAVDDGSTDDTYARLLETGAAVIRHPVNLGQGAALRTGFDFALARGARYLVSFDGDGQHRVEDAVALLDRLVERGADVALGSRFLDGRTRMPAARRRLLRAAVRFTRWVSGLPLTDAHNGLRAFRREALVRLDISQPRMAHASEILHGIARLGLRWVEVPVEIAYTERSRAKGQVALDALSVLLDLFVRRFLR